MDSKLPGFHVRAPATAVDKKGLPCLRSEGGGRRTDTGAYKCNQSTSSGKGAASVDLPIRVLNTNSVN